MKAITIILDEESGFEHMFDGNHWVESENTIHAVDISKHVGDEPFVLRTGYVPESTQLGKDMNELLLTEIPFQRTDVE